jgi:N-acetylneuraminic acid mutarotase
VTKEKRLNAKRNYKTELRKDLTTKTHQTKPIGTSTFNVLLTAANVFAAGHPKSIVQMACHRKRLSATLLIATFSCLRLLPPAVAAPGSWTQKADMPGQTSTPVGCAVDGILYIIGGHYQYTNQLRTVFAYDPQTDSWTRKKDMPTARRWPGGAAVDGIIYVISGGGSPEPPVKTVEAYDPKTDTWVTKANIPTGRNAMAACAVDGIIYAIGGFDYSEPGLATVEAYDPKTDQWTRKRDLPTGMYFATASAVDGLIYVFHGTDTFAYDPKTDHWTNKAPFSPWSSGTMSVTLDGTIYLFGGMRQGWYGSGYDFALAYDPTKDQFNQFTSRRKMPRTRAAGGCAVIDGKIYLAGGVDTEPIVNVAVYWKVLDVFDPQGGVTPQILSLVCESTNHVRLAWQGEAGLRYGVESRPNVANGSWTRVMFSSGSNSVLATNALVEATCVVPTADTKRFFRVLEL